MGRPSKNIVEFFPHICKPDKTIYILEQRFGNNGYACWFKLLEELGSHPGHYIDLSDESDLEYLSAKMLVSAPEMLEMLDLCSKLNAIDRKLWETKIIWCDTFVDNLSKIYRKRSISAPEIPITAPDTDINDNKQPVSDAETPQSIKKKSRPNPGEWDLIDTGLKRGCPLKHVLELYRRKDKTEYKWYCVKCDIVLRVVDEDIILIKGEYEQNKY